MKRIAACAVLIAGALASCVSTTDDRAAPVTCVGTGCGVAAGRGEGSPPNGMGGAEGEGEGGSDAGTSKGVLLTGTVGVLNDDVNFKVGSPYAGQVDLETEGADGRIVTAQWKGSDPFELSNVARATPVWVLATPENQQTDDVMPVLEPVTTNKPDAQGTVTADLALVRATSIDGIFQRATIPLTTDSSKAQVILRIVDKTSTAADPPGLAGVTVSAVAEDILYGATGTFSDVATTTDATGTVVLANVGGAAYPGAIVSLTFSGTRKGGGRVLAVSGAVTLTTIGL